MSPLNTLELLNKLTVSKVAELSKLSKSYISQVKHGKRPPSHQLIEALSHYQNSQTSIGKDYLPLFLQSRQSNGVSPGSLQFYKAKLGRFLTEVNRDKAREQDIERFLLQFKNVGNRHAYFRAIRAFYRRREQNFKLPKPMKQMGITGHSAEVY